MQAINPLMGILKPHSNGPLYSNTAIGYTGRWWVGYYIWYSDEGTERGRRPPSPLLAVPNVTAHPSTASIPTSYYSMWHQLLLHSEGLTAAGSGVAEGRTQKDAVAKWSWKKDNNIVKIISDQSLRLAWRDCCSATRQTSLRSVQTWLATWIWQSCITTTQRCLYFTIFTSN